VVIGSQAFAKSFRAVAFDGMVIQLERLYSGLLTRLGSTRVTIR
jgi:hypothetical protein